MLESQYQETLSFLFSRLPMFSRIGAAAFKKDLTNTIALCDFLDNPQDKFKTVHIGGTNGKGSTTNYLASMCIEAGMKVGIYTSPHLIDFRERIRIGNEMISKEAVIEFTERIKPLIDEIEPSFFEITVAMAFDYFHRENVDIAIIEVGLGGRLDSTNVIQPLLSIVTNISYDHMNMLGNTLSEIAYEKAGIIKPKTPIIIGEKQSEVEEVFIKKADSSHAKLIWADQEICFRKNSNSFSWNEMKFEMSKNELTPSYQIKNIRTSIMGFIELTKIINIPDNIQNTILNGVKNRSKNTGFLGRWTEIEYRDRKIILESAHNEAGIRCLIQEIETQSITNAIVIFGMVRDKEISHIISMLPINYRYILSQADIPRALPVKELEDICRAYNLNIIDSTNYIEEAIIKAIEYSKPHQPILITGSIFLVGEALHSISILNRALS